MQSRSKNENVSVSGRVFQLAFKMSLLFLCTPPVAELFGVGDFWLEIRVVLTDFHKDEAKKMAS